LGVGEYIVICCLKSLVTIHNDEGSDKFRTIYFDWWQIVEDRIFWIKLFNLFKLSFTDGTIRILFIISAFVFIIGISANIFIPFLFKNIVNKLYASNYNLISLLALSYGCLWVISQANTHLKDLFYNKVELHFTACVMNSMLDKFLALPFNQYYARDTGEIISIIQRTQQSISTVMMSLLFYIIPTVIEVVIISSILFYYYPIKYLIILLVTLFSFLAYNLFFSDRVTALSRQYVETDKDTTSKIVDLLMSYETIKYFHALTNAKSIYSKQLEIWEKNFSNSRTLLSLIRIGQVIVLGTGIAVLVIFCANGVAAGQISAGEFVLFIGYLLQFITPINIISYTLKDLRKAVISLEEPLNIVTDNEEKESGKTITFSPNPPSIEFKEVNFSYHKRPVFNNFSLFVKPTDKLIIMGETGAGKTTLAKCLLKLVEIESGSILINGIPIAEISSESIMNSITYCPQEVQLINGSLYDNLKFTSSSQSDEDILKAVEYAQLNHFVKNRLNNDIHTHLGERGIKLSGGEKQRIGLARLFLRNPDVCILDEPFSSVDKETAKKIYKNLMFRFKDKTVIIITHQLLEEMKENDIFYFQ
jgi:ABC-type bacteriocin/lantibiotic exporter with double-glycine peptidase domain